MRDPDFPFEKSSTTLSLIIYGRIIHSTSRTKVTILSNASLGINKHGKIAFLETTYLPPTEAANLHPGFDNASTIHLKPLQFGWTDPIEASYSDTSKASRVYPAMVAKLLANGSTTVAYNSSIHPDATNVLAEVCKEKGQRAIIGKLCIETGATHGNMEKSVEQSLQDERKAIQHILHNVDPNGDLVHPCIQPRAGSYASESLLHGLGELCHTSTDEEHGLRIQAHMCETPLEVANMHLLHPGYQSYADMYNHHGLFGPRTILAHCIHLTDRDVDLMAQRGVGVAHNPNSNTCLRDGWFRVRRLLDRGIKVGLGTDCSAGYSISVLDAMRQASNVSRHLAISTGDERCVLKFEELVYLATMGGAEMCSLSDRIGNFEKGKEFDALLVDVGLDDKINVQGREHDEDAMLKKWVFMGDDRSIRKVFVAGKLVAGKDMDDMEEWSRWA
ncbi:hypothetical protein M409DRAFT_68530 [Zasmidium cellare ATCC 36951]|uniref:Amidohydrolase-related domain-containing protein n=1 Tax=Zasmidium cellare ATCC 36951 TaxID=1080233 RepID=A0A6A6C7X9_ZASCE|nr:uncharacterized protein M409DRAFT_68530 [Zasmidium cellare ATCC 36951]KAF2163214.1 hypothetical protein M409DRAFT_68530 [Zasmidium cellare ATCC 36951]